MVHTLTVHTLTWYIPSQYTPSHGKYPHNTHPHMIHTFPRYIPSHGTHMHSCLYHILSHSDISLTTLIPTHSHPHNTHTHTLTWYTPSQYPHTLSHGTHPHMIHTLTRYTPSHAQLQSELDRALERNKELEERLNVAHIERREAQEERDAQVSKLYKEVEKRKKLEKEVSHLTIM